ncbi:MAG: phosphate acetyltransferase, partial [Campylobacterota bacterium]|nr:phosphate acetyltransferase [Campylobacterota bacterium]
HFVKQPKIAAMSVENFLSHTEDGDLIIAPGDRADIILAVIASNYSKEFPSIAGMLLTGGLLPCKNVKKLIDSLDSINFPIISTKSDTYKAAVDVEKVPAKIYPYSYRKIALTMGLFFDNVDISEIEAGIALASSNIITPLMFKYAIFERARKNIKKIVLPESSDPRILRAADILLKRGVAELILLGNKDEILHKSASLGVDISKAAIIDPLSSSLASEFIEDFYNLRKHKGLSLDGAKDAMNHVSYFGTMLVYKGYADGMVSGAIHTTQETIRPALQIIKTKKDISIVSSVFFMCFETKVLVYGDCAVNQDPTPKELAEIAISSAATAKAFGIEPKIAMLSYSTGDSGEGIDVEKVKTATKLAKELDQNLFIEGPIQYDAAIDKTVAKTKLPNSKVAGNATVFIFPDLNTGNNTYKAVQRSSGAIAIGPILQGLNKPVNDLSRGCSVEDIVNTVAITAIQADMQ